MLVPQEPEAPAVSGGTALQVAQGAARDGLVDDGDAVPRAEAAQETFGPGGGQGTRGAQQGHPEPDQGRSLGLPVVKMGREQEGGSAAQGREMGLGTRGKPGNGRGAARKQGESVLKEMKSQFPAKKQGLTETHHSEIPVDHEAADAGEVEEGGEKEGKSSTKYPVPGVKH